MYSLSSWLFNATVPHLPLKSFRHHFFITVLRVLLLIDPDLLPFSTKACYTRFPTIIAGKPLSLPPSVPPLKPRP